ncbi:MAG: sugar phosphate isomerase/epimerase family protein [Planctomycetia bacterium]|nr:sugar phosphate isomerase/epimerase family protein [Planctomycetia bacterium]
MNRRNFLKNSALAAAIAASPLSLRSGLGSETAWKTKLKKALIGGYPTEDILSLWKRNGFIGMESTDWQAGTEKAEKARLVAEKLEMEIHSVLRGWTNFNSPDTAQVQQDIESVELTLQTAKGYGANAILLVPCRTGGVLPKPDEFRVKFDPDTLMVSQVVEGDNTPYQAYIEAQNNATKASIEAVRKLIPMAEKTGVVIALENVWNNLWVTPDFFAAFVKSFRNPWIKAYFDLGNNVRYAKTEDYLYALGNEIVKLHVKDFRIDRSLPNHGQCVEIRTGSVNWPAVRKAIDDIDYNGYMTIEGGSDPIEKKSADLDLIIAGK